MADPKELFVGLGLTPEKAAETMKNKEVTALLVRYITEAALEGGCEKAVGTLIYDLASTGQAKTLSAEHQTYLVKAVADKKIVTREQMKAAVGYLGSHEGDVNTKEFNAASGVGVVFKPADYTKHVKAVMDANRETIMADRYRTNPSKLLAAVRDTMKFGDSSTIKKEFDKQLDAMLGGRKPEDDMNLKKPKAAPAEKKGKEEATVEVKGTADAAPADFIDFPDPRDNIQLKPELLANHLKATGARVVTRFPPEPNGYPHIGHAKSMSLNFGYAQAKGGYCYLRYDDTNPEAEKEEYFQAIKEAVEWLGYKPWKITCSSDHYQTMYDYAVQLIKQGDAYIDHQMKDDTQLFRSQRRNSPWRDRPIEESLAIFEDMRKGKVAEGEATLRMKMDMQSENPCMRDLMAYRVKHHPHPRTGDAWCVYPSYDFEHCIIDSIENITHSLCTLEFLLRHESYDWLVNKLGIYRSYVWEFSRLNVGHTVVSKRRLQALVADGIVDGWDDPRMPTLMGMRRRGYTPEAINNFAKGVGVTRAENLIEVEVLEFHLRTHLNEIAPRRMAVLDPLKIVLTNYPEKKVEQIQMENFPGQPEKGTYQVPLQRVVYIERSDFREEDNKNFFGLAPNKEVRLKYAYNIKCTEVVKDGDGNILELHATYDPESLGGGKKTKTLHWVAGAKAGQEPERAEVRFYTHLFLSNDVAAVDDWRDDVDEKSLTVHPNTFIQSALHGAKKEEKFQFERLGYFCVDMRFSTPEHLVFNRAVSLKEDNKKFSAE